MTIKRRKLSPEEVARADEEALAYMEDQVTIMVSYGARRPPQDAIEKQAAKVAASIKRLWRLQEGPVI